VKKPKAKRKAPAKQHQCDCPYNHGISNVYTEAFNVMMHEEDNEYVDALLHNPEFNMMADALGDEEHDPRLVMADAVRCGFEAGKRLTEIKNLEKLVGY